MSRSDIENWVKAIKTLSTHYGSIIYPDKFGKNLPTGSWVILYSQADTKANFLVHMRLCMHESLKFPKSCTLEIQLLKLAACL